jgi:hypothetical protein
MQRANEPVDIFETGFNPFIGDLPVAPQLEPLNDEWSVSDPFEPVDPRDCSKYPASPYCEAETIRLGKPVGFDAEIRSDGCTTCVYIYPVVGWLKLTPTVICRRDPNCVEDIPPPNLDEVEKNRPERYNENVQPDQHKSVACARRESIINRHANFQNAQVAAQLKSAPQNNAIYEYRNYQVISRGTTGGFIGGATPEEDPLYGQTVPFYSVPVLGESGEFLQAFVYHVRGDFYEQRLMAATGERREKLYNADGQIIGYSPWEIVGSNETFYKVWRPAHCVGMPTRPSPPPILPPPPLPPPFGRDDDRKKRGNNKMCCNDCRDSKDNTDALLKELREIRKVLGTGKLETALNAAVGIGDGSITALINRIARRIGTESYPIEVPESLIQGFGDKILKIQNNAEYLAWLTYQIDGLVGQFPIEIQVKDIDPLTAGDQTKKIQLPNIAEAIAEMYGLSLKSTVNQEIELNMLLRLAAEVIATKNGMVVTQDYARANANFLGYKANYKARELDYNFDFAGANLDSRAKEPIVLEKLLKTVKGFVQGWELEDKETVVGFLQKLMFSAGMIKAVFFRGKGQQ